MGFDYEDDEFTTTDLDLDFDQLYADLNIDSDEEYNLIPNATRDCVFGDCDHFCGEPTQADLNRLINRGFGRLVDEYEASIINA